MAKVYKKSKHRKVNKKKGKQRGGCVSGTVGIGIRRKKKKRKAHRAARSYEDDMT